MHGLGLSAGETRHYRVSAITDEEGAGPPSAAVEANATIIAGGLTSTGLTTEDTTDHMGTIDLCWAPEGVEESDLQRFEYRRRVVHPSLPADWEGDEDWVIPDVLGSVDCDADAVGFRITSKIFKNTPYAFQLRARYGSGWVISNDAEAVSIDRSRELRAVVDAGISWISGDIEVPATVCQDYDDPTTPANDPGAPSPSPSGSRTRPPHLPPLRRGGRIRSGRRRDARERHCRTHRPAIRCVSWVSVANHPPRTGGSPWR